MNSIEKYLKLLPVFFRTSAMADLEYRMNVAVKIVGDIIWYTCQLSVFEVLFKHTSTLGGWTIDGTRVFMGLLFVSDATYMIIFSENLDRFSDRVRKGELDLLLVKPVNSQFMISFKKMATAYCGNLVIAVLWLSFALSRYPDPIHWWRLCLLLILVPCSVAIAYSMRFLFSAVALILTKADNISFVWFQLYRLGLRPDSIYPVWLRYSLLTFLPVAFLASVPARLILHDESLWWLIAAVGIASSCVWFTTRFWKFALRFYTSASS